MSTGWIVLAVIVVIAIIVIAGYNGLVAMRQRVNQAFADIDVQLKQRHDLIPNLVETVKGYAAHERGTLEAVIQARNSAVAAPRADRRSPPRTCCRARCARCSRCPRPIRTSRRTRTSSSCRRSSPISRTRSPPRAASSTTRCRNTTPASSVPGRAVRRHVRLHEQHVLRPRRGPRAGRAGAAGEVLIRSVPEAAHAVRDRAGSRVAGSAIGGLAAVLRPRYGGLWRCAAPGTRKASSEMAAYGLYTHIQSNKRRSIALLVGLFFLVYVMVFAGALVAEALQLQGRRLSPARALARPHRRRAVGDGRHGVWIASPTSSTSR